MTNEEFYDAEVAPQLLALGNACKERGMPFVASVEYAQGETGETTVLTDGAGIKALLAGWSVRAHGNIDALLSAASRHAKKHGHSSVFLSQLGIPTQPPVSAVDKRGEK